MNTTRELFDAITSGESKEETDRIFKAIMIEKLKIEADIKKRELAQTIFDK